MIRNNSSDNGCRDSDIGGKSGNDDDDNDNIGDSSSHNVDSNDSSYVMVATIVAIEVTLMIVMAIIVMSGIERSHY